MTNPNQPGPNVAGHVTRTNADGTTSETNVIVDTETGNTVVDGDELSEDAKSFFELLAGVRELVDEANETTED